jgi:hypothetical protein
VDIDGIELAMNARARDPRIDLLLADRGLAVEVDEIRRG